MAYPTRPLISVPFASQMETVEKALIEHQTHPASFYGRRTRGPAAYPGLGPHSPLQPLGTHGLQAHGKTQNSDSVHAAQLGGARGLGMLTGSGISGTTPSLEQGGAVDPAPGKMKGYPRYYYKPEPGMRGRAEMDADSGPMVFSQTEPIGVPHIPQVFNDKSTFGATGMGLGPSLLDTQKPHESLATFDPFGSGDAMAGLGLRFLPIFNSSNPLLGSSFTPASSNIWGSSGKRLAGDAAVWG